MCIPRPAPGLSRAAAYSLLRVSPGPEPPRSFPRALRTHVEAEAEAAEELSPVKNRVACNHQIVRVHLTVKPAIKWFRTRY